MTKKILSLIIITVGILSIFSLKYFDWIKNLNTQEKQKIAVTIYPFYDVVKEISGDKFEVILILPPGADPHNYELKPTDLKKIKDVKIVFSNGLLIDRWFENINKSLKGSKLIKLFEVVDLIDNDPHFWLSLENMKKIAIKVRDELKLLDPTHKEYYEENFNKFLNKLNKLIELRKGYQFNNLYIITQHNSFNYLAKELNFNIIGYLETENKEMKPAEFQNLINKIKKYNLKVIYGDIGEESNLLKNIAKEFNLKIYKLDPIEGKSGLNYFEAYKYNLEILAKSRY
ncbi:MAG: metal ABC transporter substrate-binding protein [Candidatus Aenigmatarchaeota archaeon]